MKKRTLTLLLALAMLASNFAGCSEKSVTEESGLPSDAADTTPAVEETAKETEAVPDLPENVNMDGKNFNILSAGFFNWEPLGIWDLSAEEITGDSFNDAVFERNEYMKEKYNCSITEIATGHCDEALSVLQNAVTADTNDYDIALLRTWNYYSALGGKLLTKLENLNHCDYDQEWWNRDIMEQLAVGGKNYVINGGFTISDELAKNCMYFHKGLLEEFKLENPYELVTEGKWTFDKMMDMTDGVNADLDGDGKWSNADRYGIVHVDDTPGLLVNAFNSRYAALEEDGGLTLTINSEDTITKIIHMIEAFSDQTVVFNVSHRSNDVNADEMGMFMRNQTLFSMAGIWYCRTYRSMDEDFGILPYPKYDEAQQEYLSPSTAIANTLVSVPVTNTDYENTSIFLEDYSYRGHKTVLPEFYEVLLQGKVARDEESKAMLDLIFSSPILDVGIICEFGGYPAVINSKTAAFDTNIVSEFESKERIANRAIEKFVSTISEE